MSTVERQKFIRERTAALLAVADHKIPPRENKEWVICPCHYATFCGNGRCDFDSSMVAVYNVGPNLETVHVHPGCLVK